MKSYEQAPLTSKIFSFIEGNLKYYIDKIVDLPPHLKEQYYYRLWICKDDCLVNGVCEVCSCPIQKVAWASRSCNPEKHLPLMSGKEWREHKEKNNILNINEIIKVVEDGLIQR